MDRKIVSRDFRESKDAKDASGSRFEVVLLREGLGNFGDCYYYTKEAIRSLCKLAEGKQGFVNHQTEEEEEARPERDALKLFAHYENVKYREAADGCAEAVADIVVCEGSAFDRERGLLLHAIKYSQKYSDQDFVGLSIFAGGDSEEVEFEKFMESADIPKGAMAKLEQARELGVDVIRPTTQFEECESIDLVCKAGAGGRIQKMLEKEKKPMAKKKENEADPKATAAPAAGDHQDKDQDAELIKSMMDKYNKGGKDGTKPGDGDGQKEAEGEAELGKKLKSAHEAAVKCGYSGTEAEAEAVKHVKMAMHMQAKAESEAEAEKAKKESEAEAEKAKKEAEEKTKAEAEAEAEKGKKEAAAKIVSMAAERDVYKERAEKAELQLHIEGALSKSGLRREHTKAFREAAGEFRSKAEFDRAFKIYTVSRESAASGEAGGGFETAFENLERELPANGDTGEGVSFEGACEE